MADLCGSERELIRKLMPINLSGAILHETGGSWSRGLIRSECSRWIGRGVMHHWFASSWILDIKWSWSFRNSAAISVPSPDTLENL